MTLLLKYFLEGTHIIIVCKELDPNVKNWPRFLDVEKIGPKLANFKNCA
jgi:hypothetical protein